MGAQHLALLIHRLVVIDFGHKAPTFMIKLVEFMVEGGEGGAASDQGRQEPSGESPSGVIVVVIVVFFRGEEISDEGEVPGQVVFGVSGHLSPIHVFDPFGGMS